MLYKLFFLLLFSALSCSLSGQNTVVLEKKITIESAPLDITNQLLKIQEVSKTGIVFSPQIFSSSNKRKLEFINTSLAEVLLFVLAEENVNFKIIGKEIVLFKNLPGAKFTVRGFIREQKNGEGIIGAAIVQPFLNKGVYSNAYGFYSLTLPAGYHKIQFYSFGNKGSSKIIFLQKDTTINQYLETTLTLSEVIVTGRDSTEFIKTKEPSKEKLTVSEILNAPSLGGESDLIRTTFLLPGVQSGGDGLGGLFVRGGSLDQNLVLLDGVPVYNPSHIVGIFSIFNSEAIRSAELFKGAIPSRHGGRLSSVLDVRTKEGNDKEHELSFSLGLMSLKASIEGPIKREVSSFFVSYRRSILDLIMEPASRFFNERNDVEGFATYNFQDLNIKINSQIGSRDRIFLSLYSGGDLYDDNRKKIFVTDNFVFEEKAGQKLNWGNVIGSLRWNHIYGNKVFSNSTLTYSNYNFNSRSFIGFAEIGNDSINIANFDVTQFSSKIEDFAFKQDFEFFPDPNHEIRFGLNAILHRFDPSVVTLNQDNTFGVTYNNALENKSLDPATKVLEVFEASLYAEDQFKIGKKIFGNIGLRATFFDAGDRIHSSLNPRISLNFKATKKLSVFTSYDRLSQPLHLLQRSGIGLPTDLWVPSSDTIRPELGWQVMVGNSLILNDQYSLSLEGYYKKMDQLLAFTEGATLKQIDSENWQGEITRGSGQAYGLEFSLQKRSGELTGALNYTLAFSERQFENIASGNTFPFRYDRRHFFKTIINRRINEKWQFSGSWVFGTGNGITLPTSIFELPSNNPFVGFESITVLNFEKPNDFRMPNYHRLDLAMNMTVKRPKSVQKLQFGVFNVYNRANPLFITFQADNSNPDSQIPVQVSLIPFLPSFSYSIRF